MGERAVSGSPGRDRLPTRPPLAPTQPPSHQCSRHTACCASADPPGTRPPSAAPRRRRCRSRPAAASCARGRCISCACWGGGSGGESRRVQQRRTHPWAARAVLCRRRSLAASEHPPPAPAAAAEAAPVACSARPLPSPASGAAPHRATAGTSSRRREAARRAEGGDVDVRIAWTGREGVSACPACCSRPVRGDESSGKGVARAASSPVKSAPATSLDARGVLELLARTCTQRARDK